jgi:hypothetical protein
LGREKKSPIEPECFLSISKFDGSIAKATGISSSLEPT